MNPLEKRIQEEEQKSYELEQAQDALNKGLINQEEYNLLLKHDYGEAEPERTHWTLITAVFAIITVFGVFAFWGGTITGLVVFDMDDAIQGGVYTNNTQFILDADNTSTIRVSGWLRNGTAMIQAYHNEELQHVWSGEATKSSLWTNKTSYAINETINIEVTDMSNYTLWLVRSDGTRNPTSHEFSVQTPSNYTIEALGFDRKEELTITIRDDTDTNKTHERIPRVTFTNACVDTCDVRMSNPEIIITVSEGATLNITEFLITRPGENTPPVQTQDLPIIVVNETASIDLDDYFVDPDGQTLTYDISIEGVSVSLTGGYATFTGETPGTYTGTVYVSDLIESITHPITIEVLGETINETIPVNDTEPVNETVNVTEPVNETTPINETTNVTQPVNETTNVTGPIFNETVDEQTAALVEGCLASDPNKRPLECLEEANFFIEQNILLENVDRRLVARFTPIGNLLITGDLVENSNEAPGSRDWSIGYLGAFGEYTPTIWIDSSTGDLHLRGVLVEANTNIVHEEGLYGITNQRGILLGKADRRAGDLTIRGNVIPYRRSLE